MNKNREEKTICCRAIPMNLNQGMNEKSGKTHRSINDDNVHGCTSLNGDSMKKRYRPNTMTRNPEKTYS